MSVSPVAEGTPAPEFELRDHAGGTVRLEDLRGGRVVLYFYPKDDTPGCTTEACQFRDAAESYAARGVKVLGVSPDGVDSHREFRTKYDLNFPLLADPEHEVSEAYGVWGPKMLFGREVEGVHRTTFVIGPHGTVERVYEDVKPDGHAEEILAHLDEA